MRAHRTTWLIKQGKMQDALALAQEGLDYFKSHGKQGRFYSPGIGPRDVLVWEEDWESEDEHDRFWEGIRASQFYAEWLPRWNQAVERGGFSEIWKLTQ